MRLQRSKPRAFKKLAGRDIIRLGVNHNNAATVLHHQIVKGVEKTLAHPKALHLGSDAQPDCGDGEKEKKKKRSEYADYSVFVFRVSKAWSCPLLVPLFLSLSSFTYPDNHTATNCDAY